MPTSTLINITPSDITDMLGWAFNIIDSLKVLWLILIGIFLGLTVIIIIIRAVRGDKD